MTADKFKFSGRPTESDLHRVLTHIRRIDAERDSLADLLQAIGEQAIGVNVEVHTGSAEGVLRDIAIAANNELPLAAGRRESSQIDTLKNLDSSDLKLREVLTHELGPLTHQQRVGA